MKRSLLTKLMLLLCALVAGSGTMWGQAAVNSVLWSEPFTGGGNGAFSATTDWSSYVNPTTLVAADNSSLSYSSSNAMISTGSAGNMDGSHVWINRNTTGYFQIVGIKLYNTTKVKVSWAQAGASKITVSYAFDGGTSYTDLSNNSSASAEYTSAELSVSGHTTINLKFTRTSTNTNIRLDNLTLKATAVETPSVSSLSIKTAPTKTRYEVGETLDMTGFVLDADGTEKTSGYTMTMGGASISNNATLSSAGKKTIIVAYGGKEVNQNISVGAVTGIEVTTAPTKTSYNTGDSFDATGMVVTASLSTGEAESPDTWTKPVTGYTIDPEDNLAPANTSITITYSGQTTTQDITVTNVAVTGVSVKASTTIEKAKTETLTPTFTPTNATNKTVSWESDDTSVATVSAAGVVTGVAAGTANITVTTDDGGYTATCVVTVVNEKGSVDAPYSVAEVIAGTATGNDKYVVGYIVGCYNNGSKSNFGRNGATNTNLAIAEDPDEDDVDNTIAVQLPSGTLRTNFQLTTHIYYVGVTKVMIKADITSYITTTGLKNTDEMSAVAENVTVTNAGYATYVSDFGLDYSGLDVKAYKATVSGTDITFTKVTEVPAGEGVLLQNAGTFVVPVKTVTAWDDDDNAFVRGTGAAVATGTGPYNYILNNVNDVVGFYKANGQTVAKNRAYLQSTTNLARIGFVFDEGETTGINATLNDNGEMTNDKVIFNLSGQRVAQPTKGLYIVNGKKVVVK